MDTLLDVIRMVNALCATLVFGLLVFRGRLNYRNYTLREKVFQNGMLLYSFAAALASFEGFAIETTEKFTPFVILAANAYAVRAVISYHKVMFKSPEMSD